MNRVIYRITSACTALAALCFFVPYAIILVTTAIGSRLGALNLIPQEAFLATLGMSFVFLCAAVVGIHVILGDRSSKQRAALALGVYGCSAVVVALLSAFSGYTGRLDEHIGSSGFSAVGLWMLLLNLRAWTRSAWPRPLAGLGVLAAMPLAAFPVVNYLEVELLIPFVVGFPPFWLVTFSGYLILRDVQGRPLGVYADSTGGPVEHG